mmetsp:Transcript_6806/g.12639  ORF Transcript_6806/g.12639 Transcript_6806/m.12639 type:complete len:115 (+) Transcript_6806:1138-1482(+)
MLAIVPALIEATLHAHHHLSALIATADRAGLPSVVPCSQRLALAKPKDPLQSGAACLARKPVVGAAAGPRSHQRGPEVSELGDSWQMLTVETESSYAWQPSLHVLAAGGDSAIT